MSRGYSTERQADAERVENFLGFELSTKRDFQIAHRELRLLAEEILDPVDSERIYELAIIARDVARSLGGAAGKAPRRR